MSRLFERAEGEIDSKLEMKQRLRETSHFVSRKTGGDWFEYTEKANRRQLEHPVDVVVNAINEKLRKGKDIHVSVSELLGEKADTWVRTVLTWMVLCHMDEVRPALLAFTHPLLRTVPITWCAEMSGLDTLGAALSWCVARFGSLANRTSQAQEVGPSPEWLVLNCYKMSVSPLGHDKSLDAIACSWPRRPASSKSEPVPRIAEKEVKMDSEKFAEVGTGVACWQVIAVCRADMASFTRAFLRGNL